MAVVHHEDGEDGARLGFLVLGPTSIWSRLSFGIRVRIDGGRWRRLPRGRSELSTTPGSHRIDVERRAGRYRFRIATCLADVAPGVSVTVEVNAITESVQVVDRRTGA